MPCVAARRCAESFNVIWIYTIEWMLKHYIFVVVVAADAATAATAAAIIIIINKNIT